MTKTCSVPGCGRPAYAAGLCEAMYRRQRNGGDPTRPVRVSRGPLVDMGTRVTRATRDVLEATGSAYAAAAEVLECWAAGRPAPKRPNRRRTG